MGYALILEDEGDADTGRGVTDLREGGTGISNFLLQLSNKSPSKVSDGEDKNDKKQTQPSP